MESLLVNRILLMIFFLALSSTQLEALVTLVCPITTETAKRSINVDVVTFNLSNITNTAVLVEVNPADTTTKGLVIEYYQVTPSNGGNTTNQIGPTQTVTITKSDNGVITSLNPNSCYFLDVLQINDCSVVFKTSNKVSMNQVENVTAHVYNPLFNSSSDFSAQIVWKALDPSAGHTSYDVIVTTADRYMMTIWERNGLSVQDSFVNVITMTERNELMYPLETNSQYLVQVRGSDGNSNFSWSEPVLINTQGFEETLSIPDIYTVSDTNGQLLSVVNGSYTVRQSNAMVRNVFALDKRNRNIFYFNPSSSTIIKENLDEPYSSQVLVALPSSLMVHALAFDWISLKLYAAVTDTMLGVHKLYYVVDIERVNERELVFVQLVDEVIMDMTVNPFTGLIHWTEAENSQFRLKQYTIANKSTATVNNLVLVSPDISENVVRRCVYVATATSIVATGGGATCASFEVPIIQDSIRVNSLAADERGIVMTDNNSRLAYYDYQGSLLTEQVGDLPGLLQLDTVSPGTQPLPESQLCLSPDITSFDSSPDQTRTSTALFLEWDTPTTSLRAECQDIVVSTPPLIYVMEGLQSGNTFEQTVTKSSSNFERLDPLLGYNVTVRVKTSFTIGAVEELPIIANFIADPIVNRPQSTAMTMETTLTTGDSTVSTPTLSPTNNSVPPILNDFMNVITIVSISVGLGLCCLVTCIACCCCCCCIRKRSKRKDHGHSGSNQIQMPKHYLKRPKMMRRFKDDDQQPVYILPVAGEVPVYDVRENESFNENVNKMTTSASYDYPGIVREGSDSTRKNSDSYDYPRQLGSSVPIHVFKHRQSSPALSSLANSSTSFPYPSISSSSSDNQLLASAGKPDKQSKIFKKASTVEREGGDEEEEEEYVYEFVSNSAKMEESDEYTYELLDAGNLPVTAPSDSSENNVLHNAQRVDEENIYETMKSKGKRTPSTHQSSIEDEETGEVVYDTCTNDDKDCSPPPLESVRVQLRPSNTHPPPVPNRQDPSLRITQMPLPSLPVKDNVVSKKQAIDVNSEDDPVDAAGYLILKGENQNSEDTYDVVPNDVHRTHESLQGSRLQAL